MKTCDQWVVEFVSNPVHEDVESKIKRIQADALDHAAEVVAASHQSVEAEEAIKSLAKSLRG